MVKEGLKLPESIKDLQLMVVDFNERYERIEIENKLLREQIHLLTTRLYGKKSERYHSEDKSEQACLFEEAEEQDPVEEKEQSEAIKVSGHERNKPKRHPLPSHLRRVETIHDLSEEEKIHGCGRKMEVIGEERTEKLHMKPAEFWVEVHVRLKYGCKCEGVDSEDSCVKIAPVPSQIIAKSMATPSLLSHIFTGKFCDSVPFYRQEKQFNRLGIDIPRSTMCSWALKIWSSHLILYELLGRELHSGPLIHLDETRLQVLFEEGRSATDQSYMWVARGGPPDRPIVYFRYSPSRSGDIAADILKGYRGYVQTDGYAGYNFLDYSESVIHIGCWAHVRRKFYEVVKAGSKKKKDGKADKMLRLIGKLYKIEAEAVELGFCVEELVLKRQQESKPVVEEIHQFLKENELRVRPESLIGKAMSYSLKQWPRLLHFLNDGRIGLDNNRVENDIRPYVVGRKNWLFNYHAQGANASAFFFTLIETAKANGLEPQSYLLYLFENLPHAVTEEDFKKLLPPYVDKSTLAKLNKKK